MYCTCGDQKQLSSRLQKKYPVRLSLSSGSYLLYIWNKYVGQETRNILIAHHNWFLNVTNC